MNVSMDDVGAYVRASKDVLDILKLTIGLLPKGKQHDDAQVIFSVNECS